MRSKKLSLCLCLTMVLTAGVIFQSAPVYALPSSAATVENTPYAGIIERAVKTEWRYRTVNGKLQKRLWSISEGKWLSDWEWV